MIYILYAVALWSSTGVLIAWGLRRQGHHFWAYAPLGLVYGPLVLWFLFSSKPPPFPVVKTVADDHQPTNNEGWIDVLVGHDGADETTRSVLPVLELLGDSIRRLRFAGVLDFEAGTHPEDFPEVDGLEAELTRAAQESHLEHVEIVELSGRPDVALVEHATDEGFTLLVVAHRQHRLRGGVLGSTVGRLAKLSDLPVLIGPPPEEAPVRATPADESKRAH